MYIYEKKYIERFKEAEQAFLSELDAWWETRKTTLYTDAEKFFGNGYPGFSIHRNFFLSTPRCMKKLKKIQDDVQNLNLVGGGMLSIDNGTLIIYFVEVHSKLPKTSIVPYFRHEVDTLVEGRYDTFMQNFNARYDTAIETCKERVQMFMSSDDKYGVVRACAKNGVAGFVVYTHPMLSYTGNTLFIPFNTEYLRVRIIVDKCVICLSDAWTSTLANKGLCINVDNKSFPVYDLEGVYDADDDTSEPTIEMYEQGYKQRVTKLLSAIPKLDLSEPVGEKMGRVVLSDEYIFTPVVKKMIDEMNTRLPRTLKLVRSLNGDLVLKLMVRDNILKEEECHGVIQTKNTFYV